MLAVLTAMPREASSFAKAIQASPVNGRGRLLKGVIGDTGVLVSTVGIRAGRTESVVSELTREHGVTEILVLGYAGAASPGLRTGDLVLGAETCLVDDSSELVRADPAQLPSTLLYWRERSRRCHGRACDTRLGKSGLLRE